MSSSWHENSGYQPPLRRPLPETEEKLLNGTPEGPDRPKGRAILGAQASPNPQHNAMMYPNQNQNQSQPVLGHHAWGSGLSADAPVFVPGQSFASALSATAKEFVPRIQSCTSPAQPADPQYNVPMTPAEMDLFEAEQRLFEQFQRLVSIRPPHLSNSSEVTSSVAIELIKNTIHYLTTNPGQVDSYMSSVVDQLHQQTLDEATVNKITELLIEQGISEPNFHYTGAKMCQFLSKNLRLSTQTTFRQAFLKRFQEEFKKKDQWIQDPSQHKRICGLTMFLGELFLNMEVVGHNGIVAKFGAFRLALKELLLTLLSNPTDLTVKSTCQLLKLSGAVIQDTEHLNSDQGPKASCDDVFQKLQEISLNPNLGKTAQILIASVLTLKETNWGRKESSSSESAPDPSANWDGLCFNLNEPVFFDELGQPISREQAGFFDGEEDFGEYAFDSGDVAYPAWANDDAAYDPYPYDLDGNVYPGEDGMDDEMEAAYEEFLRSQGQS